MPWKVSTSVLERTAFCQAVEQSEDSMTALCRQYGISRKTGYKWLQRYADEGVEGLSDRSRRPHAHPRQTESALEAAVVAVRLAHPVWGGRKIAHVLARQGGAHVPSPSTITTILRRHGLIDPEASAKHCPCQRFAMAQPNQLWQMDYKGYFVLADHTLCHPLTVLDDCSRFLLGLSACPDESQATVQAALTALFRTYGLPERMLADNGAPWGFGPALVVAEGRQHHTHLSVWLLRLGVPLSHGRVCHPQTQGKDERLHRTLGEELLQHTALSDLSDLPGCQTAFDRWRHEYNQERPHEALEMDVPAAYYRPSLRPFPESLPVLVYDADACVRRVDAAGRLSFRGQAWRIGKAFAGEWVALEPTACDGCFQVCYGAYPIGTLDLHNQPATG